MNFTQEVPTKAPGRADFAEVFAQFAAHTVGRRLPSDVIAAVKANILDTMACAIAGSSAPGVGGVKHLVEQWGGQPQARVWTFGTRVPAHHAAWINGMMSHAREYDDTHDAAVLHAGVSVVPAAMAAAELSGKASGEDLIAGVAVGLEMICRLGVATTIGLIESGFIYTSLFGYFAATAAAARVLGLTAAQTANALGIVYSQVAGTHQVTRDAAVTKRMQPGFAAKAALMSVQLAQQGILGTKNTFQGADGFFRTYLRDRVDLAQLTDGLGQRFELLNLSYKPYPCCRFTHTAIDAALELRAPGIDIADISAIHVELTEQAYQAVCTPVDVRKAPRTAVQAQFSVPFTVACALLDGGVALRHFSDESLKRADVLALAAKVETRVSTELQRDWGRSISPAILAISMKNGAVRRARVDLPLGYPQRPMTRENVETKLRDCFSYSAVPFKTVDAWTLSTAIYNIDAADTVADLAALLTA